MFSQRYVRQRESCLKFYRRAYLNIPTVKNTERLYFVKITEIYKKKCFLLNSNKSAKLI